MNQSPSNTVCAYCGVNTPNAREACQQCQAEPGAKRPLAAPKAQVNPSSAAKPAVIIIVSFLGMCAFCGLLGTIANRRSSKTTSSTSLNTTSRARSTNSQSSSASSHPSSGKGSATARETSQEQTDETTEAELEIIKLNWVRGGLGKVAVWHLTVHNKTLKKIGEIKYETRYYTEADKPLAPEAEAGQNKHVLSIVLAPNETRTLEIDDGFTNSEAAKAQFEIKSWRFIE